MTGVQTCALPIYLIMGEKGILRRATNAVDLNEIETAKEQVSLKIADYKSQYYEEKYGDKKIESGIKIGKWIYDLCENKEIATESYTFKIMLPMEGEVTEDNPYSVIIQKNNRLSSEITGTLSLNGKLKWDDIKENLERNPKANQELKDLLAIGRIEMTLEDILGTNTIGQNILVSLGISKEELLASGKNLEEVLEEVKIDEIKVEDISDSEKLLNKIFSNKNIIEYLQKEENKEVFEKLTATEIAKNILKEMNKELYYQTARVNLTLVPSANNTGTVELSENGEYTLVGNAKLESEEVMNLKTFTFYVEVKDLRRYFNGAIEDNGSKGFASIIFGTGRIDSSHYYTCTGFLDGWTGNVLSYSNGNGRANVIDRDVLKEGWNRLAVTYDGNIFKMYVNGIEQRSCSSAKCIQTKFFVGGPEDAPNTNGGSRNGYSNGVYRNIKVYNVALDADQL